MDGLPIAVWTVIFVRADAAYAWQAQGGTAFDSRFRE
jgi:hypothetical protein